VRCKSLEHSKPTRESVGILRQLSTENARPFCTGMALQVSLRLTLLIMSDKSSARWVHCGGS
jgi:hypothetical protein